MQIILLWVATWDGLNMYDGTNFSRISTIVKKSDFKNIGSNVIQNITEDKRGNIWISTIEGISRYEKRTGKFSNYFYNRNQQGKVSEQEYAMAVDTSGIVYCLSQKSGLSFYDAAADSFKTYKLPGYNLKINKLAFDAGNHLWVLNNGQLDVYNGNKKQLQLLHTFQEKKNINNFFIIQNDLFYTTADNRLFSVNIRTLARKQVMQMPHSLSTMISYQDHYLLAWTSKGYGVFDWDFLPSEFLASETKQMQDIKITSLALGTEDILWFGTDGNGIIKIYPKTKSFGTVATSENGMPYNKSVRAFCEEDGNLWVGTKGSGIIRMKNFWQNANGTIEKEYFHAPNELDNNAVYALKKGNDDLIYIGTDDKGIGVYDLKNKKFNKWADIKGYKAMSEFGSVYAIFQDLDHSLWLGTSGYGLIHLKINKDQAGNLSIAFLEKFTFNNSDSGPANDIIYSLTAGR